MNELATKIMSVFAEGGWVETVGKSILKSVPAARWFFDDETCARVIQKDPTVFFYKGRELMTANPDGLFNAVLAVMQEDAATKLTCVTPADDPAPIVKRPKKATVEPLRGRKGNHPAEAEPA